MTLESFIEELKNNLRAGFPYIWAMTKEHIRFRRTIVKSFKDNRVINTKYRRLIIWDGMAVTLTIVKEGDNFRREQKSEVNLMQDIIAKIINDENVKSIIYVIDDINRMLDYYKVRDERQLIYTLKNIYPILLRKNIAIIFISPSLASIPIEIQDLVQVMDFPLPKEEEIRAIVRSFAKTQDPRRMGHTIEDSLLKRISEAALGLTEFSINMSLKKGAVTLDKDNITELVLPLVKDIKKQIIKKTEILELITPEENITDIGGLFNLIEWMNVTRRCLDEKAREFGIPYPKGLALVGVPGAGKSLSCKVIANIFDFPLVRLDFGRVYSSYVGESERKLRDVIKIVEAMSPCVLWIDEMEKGISGFQSNSLSTANEISQRIFATFLTWMQEKKSKVFVIATANKPWLLPPELIRKGRFDEIFFVGFPTREERIAIFNIFLRKFHTDTNSIPMEISGGGVEKKILDLSNGLTGAEIESSVAEALKRMFYNSNESGYHSTPQLFWKILLGVIKETTPLINTAKEDLEMLYAWSKGRVKYANTYKNNDNSDIYNNKLSLEYKE